MLSDDEARRHTRAARRTLRAEKLIFSRWTQVMLRFEREMYANPDQDLNKLWWKLKRRYQGLNPPDDMSGADFGAKMHVVGAPVYYHNYMLGDLFACQVHDYVTRKILGGSDPHKTCFFGSKKAGDYMREQIFAPGNLYHWQELIERATGEKLSARSFAAQYVN
jgi:peptidyl-dipeptidase A